MVFDRLIQFIKDKIGCWFRGTELVGASKQIRCVECTRQEFAVWWCGLHFATIYGFKEQTSTENVYWVCVSYWVFGVKCADWVVRCKNKSIQDEFIHLAQCDAERLMTKRMWLDGRMFNRCGNAVNVDFVFKIDGKKHVAIKRYNVHLEGDVFADQKGYN